jgi:putative membrane-bound dehydrogenase-like protein
MRHIIVMPFRFWLLFLLPLANLAAEPEVDPADLPRIAPTPPEKALGTFKIKPGFKLEIAACEPQVVDPVALSFDENGRMFVIEMRDYSERRDERLGRVRLLEDTDNDGRFEKSTVFAEGLAWPTAVFCYGGGVFVAATPDIFFLKDIDGDGKSDERRVVFTGFAKGVERLNVQAMPNSFNWSLDNRIHGATGPNGGSISRPDKPDMVPVELRGRDFSFDPRTLDFRAETGGSQHGLSFDNEGRKFVCSNSSHIQTLMYEERYAARNRVYSLPRALVDISVDGGAAPVYRISPDEPWRVIRTQWRVAGKVPGPIEGGGRASGYFTSATGVTIYRGDAYGEDFVGDAFIGDCGSNLVHRKKIRPDGVGLKAERPADEQNVEFLASTDNWFRPVQFANAPDGCLYVLDMYREVIEHPWSLPPGIKKHLDLNRGNDRGRIYRIAREKSKRRGPVQLGKATTAELVKTLEHANGWHRDTAARLLYERQDKSVVRQLRLLAEDSKVDVARLHALYALAGLGELKPDDFGARVTPSISAGNALSDSSPAVRKHALRLIERFPAAWSEMVRMEDDDPEVRYQLALFLGAAREKAAPLAILLERHGDDPWMRAAILSSLDTSADDGSAAAHVFAMATGSRASRPLTVNEALPDLARLIGAQGRASSIASVVRHLSTNQIFSIASALADGLKRSQRTLAEVAPRDLLGKLADEAARISGDAEQPVAPRKEAVAFLASGDSPEPLLALLQGRAPAELQIAAVRSLAQFRSDDIPAAVLPLWPKMQAKARAEIINALVARPKWAAALMDALEGRVTRVPDFDKKSFTAQQIQSLANHSDPAISRRARNLFSIATNAEREKLVQQFMSATRAAGDARTGRVIYRERCASCHKFGNEGHAVGPEVVTMKASGKEKLLVNIIDPNREVLPQFQSWSVETTDGETVTGLLLKDSAGSLALATGSGAESTFIRAQVRKLTPQKTSLMPEGLEAGLTEKQMSDLLEFLSNPESTP